MLISLPVPGNKGGAVSSALLMTGLISAGVFGWISTHLPPAEKKHELRIPEKTGPKLVTFPTKK